VLQSHHLLERILKEQVIDLVVFENRSVMPLASVARRLSPSTVFVLNAYNIDHRLLAQEYRAPGGNSRRKRKSYRTALWQERNLGRYVDTFWACSEVDRRVLEETSGLAGSTIPNGVDTTGLPFSTPRTTTGTVLFCGSLSYHPNAEGLRWFGEQVWSDIRERVPEACLHIVGRGGNDRSFGALCEQPGVELVGEVASVIPHYHAADLAICPLMSGSGTRLKILEAMSLGCPVVSTTPGAEGIDVADDTHILLADTPTAFADAVVRLLKERELRERLRRRARELVEKTYDWNVIGDRMNAAVERLLARRRRECG